MNSAMVELIACQSLDLVTLQVSFALDVYSVFVLSRCCGLYGAEH